MHRAQPLPLGVSRPRKPLILRSPGDAAGQASRGRDALDPALLSRFQRIRGTRIDPAPLNMRAADPTTQPSAGTRLLDVRDDAAFA